MFYKRRSNLKWFLQFSFLLLNEILWLLAASTRWTMNSQTLFFQHWYFQHWFVGIVDCFNDFYVHKGTGFSDLASSVIVVRMPVNFRRLPKLCGQYSLFIKQSLNLNVFLKISFLLLNEISWLLAACTRLTMNSQTLVVKSCSLSFAPSFSSFDLLPLLIASMLSMQKKILNYQIWLHRS